MFRFFILCLSPFFLVSSAFAAQKGILLKSDETAAIPFELGMRFRIQSRIVADKMENNRPAEWGGFVRRTRLRFGGWVLSPRLRVNLQFSFTRGDQDWDDSNFPNVLRDAAVQWAATPSLTLIVGQTKLPGNRQRVVSSGDQQMPDRSLVNRYFNLDRDFGLQLHLAPETESDWKNLRVKTALTSAGGRNDIVVSRAVAWTHRLEFQPLGAFTNDGDDFESDLENERRPKLAVAVGYSRMKDASRSSGTIGKTLLGLASFTTFYSDFLFKHRGYSLAVEWMDRTASAVSGTLEGSGVPVPLIQGHGGMIQGGKFLTERVEIVGRLTYVRSRNGAFRSQNEYGGGINYYFARHRIKWQNDIALGAFNEGPNQWQARTQLEFGI